MAEETSPGPDAGLIEFLAAALWRRFGTGCGFYEAGKGSRQAYRAQAAEIIREMRAAGAMVYVPDELPNVISGKGGQAP